MRPARRVRLLRTTSRAASSKRQNSAVADDHAEYRRAPRTGPSWTGHGERGTLVLSGETKLELGSPVGRSKTFRRRTTSGRRRSPTTCGALVRPAAA